MKTKSSPRSEARPGTRPAAPPVARTPIRPPARPAAKDRTDHGPIALPGTLLVKWINGRNGEFAVGDLRTSIGEFRVKDSLLDQFDEGAYEGTFWISQIFSKSYEYRGRITIETRAVLADLQVDVDADGGVPDTEPAELDPAEEPPPAPPKRPERGPTSATTPDKAHRGTADLPSDDADRQLFGDELYDLVVRRQTVKLDSTVDRLRLRRQRDRLYAMGFDFKASTQTWHPAGA